MIGALTGRVKLGAHVEVFRRDEETGEKVLVSTSRPCVECGQPLDGLVVPYNSASGEQQIHARCRDRRKTVGF